MAVTKDIFLNFFDNGRHCDSWHIRKVYNKEEYKVTFSKQHRHKEIFKLFSVHDNIYELNVNLLQPAQPENEAPDDSSVPFKTSYPPLTKKQHELMLYKDEGYADKEIPGRSLAAVTKMLLRMYSTYEVNTINQLLNKLKSHGLFKSE